MASHHHGLHALCGSQAQLETVISDQKAVGGLGAVHGVVVVTLLV